MQSVIWAYVTESPWIFFGDEIIDKAFVDKTIQEWLSGEELYLVSTKQTTVAITKLHAMQSINNLLAQQDFFIWYADFITVIQFSKDGVMRCGTVHEKPKESARRDA